MCCNSQSLSKKRPTVSERKCESTQDPHTSFKLFGSEMVIELDGQCEEGQRGPM